MIVCSGNSTRVYGSSRNRICKSCVFAVAFFILKATESPTLSNAVVQTNTNVSLSVLRTAYLISVNATSSRTVHSVGILQRVGFSKIELELAINMGDSKREKTYSNKMAQLNIFEKIANGSEPWGYIFEDDITLCRSQSHLQQTNPAFQFSVFESLICHTNNRDTCLEMQHRDFVYLGICSPLEIHPSVSQERKQMFHPAQRYCGRCAHAYGISRNGAKRVLEFEKSYRSKGKRNFMDAVIDSWCRQSGGFPVSDMQCERKDAKLHFGSFIQDQHQFPSIIGQ